MKISKLKFYRIREGLSQERAAKQIGISRSYLSLFEIGGAIPDTELLVKMARVYGVDPQDLL